MKKSLLALAALSAVAGAASAQVTLSGGVDLGVARVDDNTIMQTAGKSARSNLTFSGKEDLGDGNSAYFVLNARFKPESGQMNPGGNDSNASQFFRNSFVGLAGNAGDIRLGRYLSPHQELNGNYDAFGIDTVGSVHTGGIKGNVRVNSAVEYRSPTFSGVQVLLMTADTNAQGVTGTVNRPMGASVSFNQGPISLALATDKTAGDLKTNGLYGKFTLPNKAAVMFQYEKGDTSTTTSVKRYSISAKMPVNAFDIKAGYLNQPDEKKKKLGLGVDYNLSKRTQVYADLGKQSGDGYTGAAGELAKKTQYDIGIYHKF